MLMFQPLMRYADFQGRARRSEFWLWVLFRFVLGGVCSTFLLGTMFNGINFTGQNTELMQNALMNNYMHIMPFYSAVNLISLGLLIPSIAVGVRRLHDSNRSGFWLLMPYVTMFVGITALIIFGLSAAMSGIHPNGSWSDAQIAKAFMQVMAAVGVFFLIFLIIEIIMLVFFVADGTAGPNRFGPDPKGRGNTNTNVF